MICTSILVGIICIACTFSFMMLNPILFDGLSTGISQHPQGDMFFILTQHFVLDSELPHIGKEFMSKDEYLAYRNHCLRIISMSHHLLPGHVKEDIPEVFNLIATAVAYHKIGLWIINNSHNETNNKNNNGNIFHKSSDHNGEDKPSHDDAAKDSYNDGDGDGDDSYLYGSNITVINHNDYRKSSIDTLCHYVKSVGLWENEQQVEIMKQIIANQYKFLPFDYKEHYLKQNKTALTLYNEGKLKFKSENADLKNQQYRYKHNGLYNVTHINTIVNVVRRANWAESTYRSTTCTCIKSQRTLGR